MLGACSSSNATRADSGDFDEPLMLYAQRDASQLSLYIGATVSQKSDPDAPTDTRVAAVEEAERNGEEEAVRRRCQRPKPRWAPTNEDELAIS